MKKRQVRKKKKKVLNTFSLILLAVVFVEIILIANSTFVGNAVKSISKSAAVGTAKTSIAKVPACVPTKEICDGKDNDCDKLVDEDGVCEKKFILDKNPFSLSPEEINKQITEKGALWTAKENLISKLSNDEKKKRLGLKPPSNEKLTKIKEIENSHKSVSRTKSNLPDFFDWRNVGGKDYVSPVKNQASCGSCWAFGAVATLEDHINAYYNNPNLDLDLSEQDLVSCYLSNGCDGAYDYQIESIFSAYYQNTGIATEACFPYFATNVNCASKCSNWQQDAWKTLGYESVSLTIEDIKQAVIDHGSVEVGMIVYSDFLDYAGGVYSHTIEYILGYHAVTIVGFGKYDGLDYWIVKNSWGPDWGENGYFRIVMGDSGIDSWYAFAVTELNPPTTQSKICTDNDHDSYCYWGLGSKPLVGCPSCNDAIYDCDDSNASIYQGCGISTESSSGFLSVNSTPSNAEVYVKDLVSGNWIYRGNTPKTFNLKTGVREIKIKKNFFEDYNTTIFIDSNETAQVQADLTPHISRRLIVDASGGGDYIDINSAIKDAASYDVIFVRNGNYYLNETINIKKSYISIIGESTYGVKLISTLCKKVKVYIGDNVYPYGEGYVIENITLYNISLESYVTIKNSLIENNIFYFYCNDYNAANPIDLGLFDSNSDYTSIINNKIYSYSRGIRITPFASYNLVIENNTIFSNSPLTLDHLSNGIIKNNILHGNKSIADSKGINLFNFLYPGQNLTFKNNKIDNFEQAFYSASGVLINFNENLISNCTYGIMEANGINNIYYHNNFYGQNLSNVIFSSGFISFDLSNGSLFGLENKNEGNYWENYSGQDANNDGIGDAPYMIYGNSKDNYPLMKPYLHFICGDADGNGQVDISDAVFLINYVFTSGSPAPNPLLAGDADGNGIVNIGDPVYLINYIFGEGPAPCNAGKNYVQDKTINTKGQVTDYMNTMKQKATSSKKSVAVA